MMKPNLARILESLPQAFSDGLTVESVFGHTTLRHQRAGDLIVTSGSIVACDPKWIEESTIWPFMTRLALGQYPIILSIAHLARGDHRVAYAILRLGEQVPVRWDVAMFPKEAKEAAGGGLEDSEEIIGYPVDSGKGCFMDVDAARVWTQKINTIADYDQRIDDEMDKTGVDTYGWANISLEPDSVANLIAFSTGVGDGTYASFFGYDADDSIVCLVTDFALLWSNE